MRLKIFAILLFSMLSGCADAQKTARLPEDKNILIVYLSRTRNTEALAGIIHQNTGGTKVAIEVQNPYPEDYKAIVEQVRQENETGFLPHLKTEIKDIEKYDVVFIGFPTWGMQLPPPVKSFLKRYDLSGKTIVPFNTHAGYGVGSGFQNIKELCPKSIVSEGFSTRGGVERDGILYVMEGEKEKEVQAEVRKWLGEINLLRDKDKH